MTQNLLRVEQINANFLDKEIYNVLHHLLENATKNLPVSITVTNIFDIIMFCIFVNLQPGFIVPFEHELKLLLHVALIYNSVVRNGSTFGQQLLSIKYESISGMQKVLYLFGNCFDYMKNKLESWNPSHNINNTMYKIDLIRKIMNFINISIFLRRGTKLLLIERFLGLKQVYTSENVQRQYTSKYLARELLWNGFIVSTYILVTL